MDVLKMIQDLLDERDRIDATIAKLEALRAPGSGSPSRGKRGRKAMSLSEREEVSRRMRNYWDQRRRQALTAPAPVDGPPQSAELAPGGPEPSPVPDKSRAASTGK